MEAKIVTTYIGIFGIDEKKEEIITFEKFGKNPEEVAGKLKLSGSGYIDEERKVKERLEKEGYDTIEKGKSDFINKLLPKFAVEKGIVKTAAEFNQIISKVNVELTKARIRESVGKDKLIIQLIGAIDELDKSTNILAERLMEWYGLHFPEMAKLVKNNEKYAEIVGKFGYRNNIDHPELSYYREKSMGMEFDKKDSEAVKMFAQEISELYELRSRVMDYMDEVLKEIAPNTREIAGPMLAAKLISLSGGLDKLARMPSSTIQLLGAEKALFRHLKGKGKSPKHGVIIMHPYVQKAPKALSGKLSRVISSKISIAAKLDQYSDKHNEKELKKDLDEKVKEILGRTVKKRGR